jgi:hypothetical protein
VVHDRRALSRAGSLANRLPSPSGVLAHEAAGHCGSDAAEGVGVAPTIPTLGDRRASGHSIIGLAVFDHAALHAEAIDRCWSRGRLLAWLTDCQVR